MRLIDADALIEDIREHSASYFADDFAHEWVDQQPTIKPVRKGHWIIYTLSMFDGEDCKCSECGQTSCAPYWHYCPNCGAKMKGCEQDG